MGDLQRHLQLALEAAHMALWDSVLADGKLDGSSVNWSAQGAALLGLPAAPLKQSFAAFLDCVHPDDRARVRDVLQDGIDRRDGYALEYRVLWPDGSLHWLAAKARVFCDAGGQPERTLGMIWEVSERKRSEALLAERKELAEVTLASIADGVIATDAHGRTRYLNRVAEELTGWTGKLARGKDIGQVLRLAEQGDAGAEHAALKCLRRRQAIGVSPHTELLIGADQACYLAKEQGRNRIHVYRESDLMLARRHGEMTWVARLNEAFERRHFRLYAMPIVQLNGAPEAHDEVLIRIINEQGDLILPDAFIPAAERYDLILGIDRWVIQAVCRHIKSVRDALPALAAFEESHRRAPALYSINLSGMSLSDPGLQDYITNQFVEHEIAPEQICFEITETAAIANLPGAQAFIAALKALGCRFSLDHFGSGLSSFGYLKALAVDYLKIDGVFVRGIASNPVNRALVKAINEVGHVMGLLTVAEYVEDDATLEVVRALGVDYAQGYAVGPLRALQAGVD